MIAKSEVKSLSWMALNIRFFAALFIVSFSFYAEDGILLDDVVPALVTHVLLSIGPSSGPTFDRT